MQDIPIYIGGRVVGRVTETREGLYTLLRAECEPCDALVRLWLFGAGRSAYFGLLEPRGGRLTLTRRLSRAARAALPERLEYAADVPNPPAREADAPPSPPSRGELLWFTRPDGSLTAFDGRTRYLALPAELRHGDAQGRLREIGGRKYLVFRR